MSETDFAYASQGTTGGVKSMDEMWGSVTKFIAEHPKVIVAIIIILVILVIALFFSWVSGRENLSCSTPGNQSPLCGQIREGPGESLTNSALMLGYGADPKAFCRTAGKDSADPQDYLRHAVEGEESLSGLSPQDAMDRNLMIAMQH